MATQMLNHRSDLNSIAWYFDSLEQERVEKGRPSLRSAQFIQLQRRLNRLSDRDFDKVMESVEGVIAPFLPPIQEVESTQENRKRNLQLYQETKRQDNEIREISAI